jgi:hypothetical protein
MKNPNDPIGNRIRDLPACSAVPQQTELPRNPVNLIGDREVRSESTRINTVDDSTEYNPSSQTLKNLQHFYGIRRFSAVIDPHPKPYESIPHYHALDL